MAAADASAAMATAQAAPFPPWAAASGQSEEQARIKRYRVTLACTRCKTRKQKCDGNRPCAKCRANSHDCEYIVPQKPMPFGKKQYILALERRVAELETILTSQGMPDQSNDHWTAPRGAASTPTTSQQAASATSENKSVHSSPTSDLDDPSEAVLDWRDGVDSVVSVLRSLSLDVNGSGYVGASSHVALGRLFGFLEPRDQANRGTGASRRGSRQHLVDPQPALRPLTAEAEQPIDFGDVPDITADRLYGGYLKHIATRWPVCYSPWVRSIHDRRHSLSDVFEIAMLQLVYATAGRFLETTGETGSFHPKRHYASASRALSTILGYNDMRTVQVLMLMAIYSLRDSVGAGAWACSRTALLIAIDHGMHRQTKALSRRTTANELRKRLFWSCYAFDRQISIPMGRPFGISDRDIDIELPLNIDEDATDEQLAAVGAGPAASPMNTSLTSFIMVVRLRQIESDIQQTVYRVDQETTISDSIIDGFLARLEQWKATIPDETRHVKDSGDTPFDGYDYYMVYYFKCKRLLLYPQISKTTVAPRFLKECARACAGVCGAYKRLHQTLAVGYSLMALQTVFMAGLTLIYCVWISPDEIFDMTTSNGIHDCTIVLYVIAERVASGKKYRNAFEVIRQKVIDQISGGAGPRRRETVSGLTADLAPSAQSFQVDMPTEVDNGSFEQFTQIITDMAGEDFRFDGFTGVEQPADPSFAFGADDQTFASFDQGQDFASPTFDFSLDSELGNEAMTGGFAGR